MSPTRTCRFTTIKILLLSISVLTGVAAAAQASTLTLSYSGNVDLSSSGGAASNPFSGFITWDPNRLPSEVDATSAEYDVEAYQFIFNGIPRTLGAGIFVINNGDPFQSGANVDAFVFGAVIAHNAMTGDDLILIGALSGPPTTWNTLSLPTDYSFLSQMTARFSLVSLEVAGGDDDNDIIKGRGTLAVTPVPEPATLTLTALGLAGVRARARRGRQLRDQ
jgi:hypothetical protein